MTDSNPPAACSLGAGELEQRVAAIGEVGTSSLISHVVKDDTHLLRFRANPPTRRQLEEIVAAETECCPFLALSLSEKGDELTLSIAAPADGLGVATQLAEAFSGGLERNG